VRQVDIEGSKRVLDIFTASTKIKIAGTSLKLRR